MVSVMEGAQSICQFGNIRNCCWKIEWEEIKARLRQQRQPNLSYQQNKTRSNINRNSRKKRGQNRCKFRFNKQFSKQLQTKPAKPATTNQSH
ncbi:uncharacterized protein DS421_13g424700 [Arachis hypogaea]|nr:uncharacterized protein DS421_13g424700 [Arachis hypogaea]